MFYTFRQNSSGGNFIINDRIAIAMIIEAPSAEIANHFAEAHSIYFDGCAKGRDCSCCDDRWSRQWCDSDGNKVPSIYDLPAEEYVCPYTKPHQAYAHIFYLDGSTKALKPEAH